MREIQTLLDERHGINRRAILEAVQAANIDLGERLCPDILEAALRQTTVERHLAALKTGADTAARAGLLPLHAAAGGLAHAGADAAADALTHGTRALRGL